MARMRCEIWEVDPYLEQGDFYFKNMFEFAQDRLQYYKRGSEFESLEAFARQINQKIDNVVKFQDNGFSLSIGNALYNYFEISIACAVPLLLADDLIQSYAYAWRRTLAERDAAGPQVGTSGCNLGRVLRATENNFRHYQGKGWKGSHGSGDAKKDIEVLRAIGVDEPFDRVVAPEVFLRLRYADYPSFREAVRATILSLRPADRAVKQGTEAWNRGFR